MNIYDEVSALKRAIDCITQQLCDALDRISVLEQGPGEGVVTPPPPTNGIVDDVANTFAFTLAAGYTLAEHEYTFDGGETIFSPATNPIVVGNVDRPVGMVRVRVKAGVKRLASAWLVNNTAFTSKILIIPPAPTNGVVDDNNNTFSFTLANGYTLEDHEYTLDGGVSIIPNTSNPLVVGNIARPIGSVKVRVKANSDRVASQWLSNTQPFTELIGYTVYYGWADSAEYPTEATILASENHLLAVAGNPLTLPFHEVLDWKHSWFAIPDTEPLKTNWDGQNSPLNRGEIGNDNLFGNPVHIGSFYYYFTTFATIFDMPVVITGGGTQPDVIEPGEIPEPPETITPEPPVLVADDTLNTLAASHTLGVSEILVSINGAAYVQYTATINVGDADRAIGYYKFKIKSAEYRNESAVVESPAFTKHPVVVPDQYTLTVQVNGVSTYTVYINGSPIVGNTITVEEGTVLNNIVVIRTGYNISPPSVASVTMDQNRTLVFQATEIPVVYPDRTLTIVVNGLHEAYQLFINGIEQTGALTFSHGTILDDVSIEVDGYTISPAEHDDIVMDQNRTLIFNATRITHVLTIDTGGISGVELYIDEVLHTGPLVFNHGTSLQNLSIHKAGFTFTPSSIPSVLMDGDKTISFTGTAIPQYTLTVNVDDLESDYTLTIDGQVRTGNTFTYNADTVINEVKVSAQGYTFSPVSHGPITMSQNRSVSFVATQIPMRTLSFEVPDITDYIVTINGIVQPSGPLAFYEGTILNNIVLSKDGYTFTPGSVPSLTMDADKVLSFTVDIDYSAINYLPGFTAYDPRERYARQGGVASVPEISPGEYQIVGHRVDFISWIRVPVGGEIALKCKGTEATLALLNSTLPWPNEENKEDYGIDGSAGGIIGKDGFYGDGIINRVSTRDHGQGDAYHGTIQNNEWVLLRRIDIKTMNVYVTNGTNEDLRYSMTMPVNNEADSGYYFNYLKHTIWDEGTINFPSVRGCFHELNDTWPPVVVTDNDANLITASHSEYEVSEIMYSENNGPWTQYTEPIQVGNVNIGYRYFRFKIKSATGRPESPEVYNGLLTQSSIPEGLQNLVFSDLTSLAYNAGTNTYSFTEGNTGGNAENSQILLPVTGSAAIYFSDATFAESKLVLGFDSVKESRNGDMDVSIVVNKWYNSTIEIVTRGFPFIPTGIQLVSGVEYRLVCRNYGWNRVWRIEGSTDNWATYEVLYTIDGTFNSKTLYPKMQIPSFNNTTIQGLKIEFYLEENIDEMEVVTPDAPTDPVVDNVLDTFNWTNSSGYSNVSDYEITINGGSSWTIATAKPYYVGNIDKAVGQVGVRVRAVLGRTVSGAIFNQTAYTEVVNTTPAAPTVTGNDTTNILSASHALGDSEILVSVNNEAYSAYSGPINVGNVNRAAGYWKFKIKSAVGRNESSVANSPVFTETAVIDEGKFDLTFSTLSNLSYDSVTKEYIPVNLVDQSYGSGSGKQLPVNGSGAIYFSGASRRFWIGFSLVPGESHYGNWPVAVGIKYFAKQLRVINHIDGEWYGEDLTTTVESSKYRLICRTTNGQRVWTIEGSANNFASYDTIYTLPFEINDQVLYPSVNGEPGSVSEPAFGKDIEFEIYLDQNIPTVPSAPTIIANDFDNTLSASHVLGASEIVFSVNDGSYQQYTGQINVGDVALPVGYYKFKTKAATGRAESLIAVSPAFTEGVPTDYGNYLPGFAAASITPDNSTGALVNQDGQWVKISEADTTFVFDTPMTVGAEFAVKVLANSYIWIGSRNELYSVWADTDAGVSLNDWANFPNLVPYADREGFLIFRRVSSTTMELFHTKGPGLEQKIHTFTTVDTPEIVMGGYVANLNSSLAYPQIKS